MQRWLDVARIGSRSTSASSLNAKDANDGGKFRLEASAAVYWMQKKVWARLVDELVGLRGMAEHTVEGGERWEDVCCRWWGAFLEACGIVWQTKMLSGKVLRLLFNSCQVMGVCHRLLGFKVTLWAHLWVDHMHAYACLWRTLARFGCFAVEGSHRRLKRMLRNSGGVSLLHGRNGLQVVVDNHTIDDSLLGYGWDVNNRAGRPQVISRYLY